MNILIDHKHNENTHYTHYTQISQRNTIQQQLYQ